MSLTRQFLKKFRSLHTSCRILARGQNRNTGNDLDVEASTEEDDIENEIDPTKQKGEDFQYWHKYLYWNKAKTYYGRDIYNPLSGWKSQNKGQWYYNEDPPHSRQNIMKQQQNLKMPLVQPLKRWDIFLGDKVELLQGPDKGKIGEVFKIVKERNWVFVDGLNIRSKPDKAFSKDDVAKSDPMHYERVNNLEQPLLVTRGVKLIDPSDQRATEVVWRYTEEGEEVRVSARTGRIIPLPQLHLNTWVDYKDSSRVIAGEKDTPIDLVEQETYSPKLCTFEEDICKSMNIKYKPRKKRGHWY